MHFSANHHYLLSSLDWASRQTAVIQDPHLPRQGGYIIWVRCKERAACHSHNLALHSLFHHPLHSLRADKELLLFLVPLQGERMEALKLNVTYLRYACKLLHGTPSCLSDACCKLMLWENRREFHQSVLKNWADTSLSEEVRACSYTGNLGFSCVIECGESRMSHLVVRKKNNDHSIMLTWLWKTNIVIITITPLSLQETPSEAS